MTDDAHDDDREREARIRAHAFRVAVIEAVLRRFDHDGVLRPLRELVLVYAERDGLDPRAVAELLAQVEDEEREAEVARVERETRLAGRRARRTG